MTTLGGGDADYDDIVIAMFPDADEDGVADGVDNCVDIYNPDQVDEDQDGLGDYCDDCPGDPFNDIDKDGVCGDVDNCPDDANSNQDDGDDDGIGYLCDNCKNAPNGFNLGTCVYKNFTDQGVVLTTGDTCSSVNSCPADEDYEEVYCSLNQEDIDNDGDGDACDITELVGSQIGAITLCELTVDGDPNTAADAFAALDWKRGFFFVTLKNQDGEELRVNNSVPRDLRVKKESDENGIVHYVYDNDSDVVEIDPPLNLKIPIDLTDGRFDPEEVAAAESLTATCHLIADIPDPDCTGQGIAEFCPSTPLQPLVVSSPPFPVLPIREVDINVKPWGPFNIIFLKSNDANRDTYCGPLFLHRLRVAILGSQDLKVKKIPIPSIRFQDAQVATYDENGKPVKFILDINHDGYDDLVVAFDKKDLNLTAEDKLAKLSGEAHYKNKKFAFTGSDFVKVSQCKRN